MKGSIQLTIVLLLFTTCVSLKINHNTGDDYSLCDTKNKCVKKCCPEKHVLINKVCTLKEDSQFSFKIYDGLENVTDDDITFHVIHDRNSKCSNRPLKLSPSFIPSDVFYIQSDGSIFKPFDTVTPSVHFKDYCMETFELSSGEEFSALVCYEDSTLEQVDRFSYIGKYQILHDGSNVHFIFIYFFLPNIMVIFSTFCNE